MKLQSRNPAMQIFEKPQRWEDLEGTPGAGAISGSMASARSETMTVAGTAIKTAVLLVLCIGMAAVSWVYAEQNWITYAADGAVSSTGPMFPVLLGTMVVGLVFGLGISFVPKLSPWVSWLYALIEGVFLGLFSMYVGFVYLGGPEMEIVGQAIGVTLGIAGGALIAYGAGWIRIGSFMRKMIIVAISGVAVYAIGIMLCNGLLGMGIPNMFWSASPIGIGFSVLLIVLASLTLVLDYQMIDEGVQQGAPKYLEWYGAFSLLVSLVWLYIEVLRLLAKLRSND